MLKFNILTQDKATIVEINGEIDMYSSPEMRKVLLQLTDDKTTAIIINFQEVEYIDSSGIATLVEALQEVEKYQGKFLLTNLSDKVMDVFALSRLDKVFDIYESLEDALKNVILNGTHK
jgi:anti-sigma B factor antagonist